jgi:putative FmdB family regulatory protein
MPKGNAGARRSQGMPVYEFYCNDCQKEFTLALTVKEYEKEGFVCPFCKGKNVERQVSVSHVITSKKS